MVMVTIVPWFKGLQYLIISNEVNMKQILTSNL